MRRAEIVTILRRIFAYNSSMQLAAPQPRRHEVLMSFRYWNAWDVIFFDTDRMRTQRCRGGHASVRTKL
jgi:hypothetical protein